ncbi:metallophosphoesterase [Chloroflexi bacterium TSY]|nr:metallophosphoesterase [Chloroflexi bacterium TSY]
MKLFAISDLHLSHSINREALIEIESHPDDWLIVAGDVGELEAHFHIAWSILTERFARVLWTPGNHDLWTFPTDPSGLRGEAKYRKLVALCRDYGVVTPEDPYERWPDRNGSYLLAPLFTLYDYSFRPPHVALENVIAWAEEINNVCTDEAVLHPDPYLSRGDWCVARCRYTEERLKAVQHDLSLILINHYPLRQELLRLKRIPRFTPWCGTTQTVDWHRRFQVDTVIYGHLHIRMSDVIDGVRFEEVSLGYPRQWDQGRGVGGYLKQIL